MVIGCLNWALSSSGKKVFANGLRQSSPCSEITRFMIALREDNTRFTVEHSCLVYAPITNLCCLSSGIWCDCLIAQKLCHILGIMLDCSNKHRVSAYWIQPKVITHTHQSQVNCHMQPYHLIWTLEWQVYSYSVVVIQASGPQDVGL